MKRNVMLSAAAALVAIGACGKEPPKRVLTARPAPAEDTTPVTPVTPTPAAVSRLGNFPLLRVFPPAPDGQCDMSQSARLRIIFSGDQPARTVSMDLGDSSRAFRPRIVEVKGSQSFLGTDETETAYAWFSANGNVETATRSYSATGAKPANESRRMTPEEIAQLKAIAESVLGRCT